jgi:mRNA interferase RelE/StbE
VSRYTVYTTPSALQEAKDLPGHMRQRVKRAVRALADNPRPAGSKELDVPELEHEVRRLKLDKWRVVYAIAESDKAIDVLAVRRRPPYDYGDLAVLLRELM